MSGLVEKDPWHLDKRIPIALVVLILGQSVGFGMWLGATNEKMSSMQKEIADLSMANQAISELRLQLLEIAKASAENKRIAIENREWQVRQRVRVWNRVDNLANRQNDFSGRIQTLEAVTRQTNEMVSRLLSLELASRGKGTGQ